MVHTLSMVEKSLSAGNAVSDYPTMFDKRTRASADALQKMKDIYGYHVWGSVIPIDTKFRDASKAGQPLSQFRAQLAGQPGLSAITPISAWLGVDDSDHDEAGSCPENCLSRSRRWRLPGRNVTHQATTAVRGQTGCGKRSAGRCFRKSVSPQPPAGCQRGRSTNADEIRSSIRHRCADVDRDARRGKRRPNSSFRCSV